MTDNPTADARRAVIAAWRAAGESGEDVSDKDAVWCAREAEAVLERVRAGWVELPRPHDLAPRSWRLPTGEIVGDAVNQDAVNLLKSDPNEFFRRTRQVRDE